MKYENASFTGIVSDQTGLIHDASKHSTYPYMLYCVVNGQGYTPTSKSSAFGYMIYGTANLNSDDLKVKLCPRQSFSVNGNFQLTGSAFKAIIIEPLTHKGYYKKAKYRAFNQVIGALESKGRLKYIDGCTDTLLIPPVKMGNPCLNHLHFPKNITQTPHTHPTDRIGVVAKGKGECETPFGNVDLVEGMIFIIKQGERGEEVGLDGETYDRGTHKFNTTTSSMDVIAFHPDSDFGAQDEDHPMINRTIVDGQSAKYIDEIKTQ